jgi:hypothetical protein
LLLVGIGCYTVGYLSQIEFQICTFLVVYVHVNVEVDVAVIRVDVDVDVMYLCAAFIS